jgi:NAD-dependent SIR2 family protein deacetylase
MLNMKTKKCCHCKETKPVSDFYKDSNNKDGLYNNCKSCHNFYTTQYGKTEKYKKWRLKYISRFFKTPKGRIKRRKIQKAYRIKHPLKARARGAIHNATQRGKLPRVASLKCFKCGKKASNYHHLKGYEIKHRLNVVPVCISCHFSLE